MKLNTCLCLALLGVPASASQEEWAITTIIHRVTTYLPYEQHRCTSLFLLNSNNPKVPQEACLPGACCMQIVKENDCIQEIIPTGDYQEKLPTEKPMVTGTDVTMTAENTTQPRKSDTPTANKIVTGKLATSGSEKAGIETLEPETSRKLTSKSIPQRSERPSTSKKPSSQPGNSKVTSSMFTSSSPSASSTKRSSDNAYSSSPKTSSSNIMTSTLASLSETPSSMPQSSLRSSAKSSGASASSKLSQRPSSSRRYSSSLPASMSKTSPSATSTKSSTTYTKACPTPTCQSGIENALFSNPFRSDTTSNYTTFNPSHFKTQKPLDTRVVSEIYVRDDGKNKTLANAALEYRAFLFACQDGTYRFNSPRSDDITIMWFGDKAYEGWTRDNADIIQFYYGDNKPKDVTRSIKAGTYYPIRVMWGNTGGAADLSLRIYAPDGRELFGHGQDSASYLTTEACDGSYEKFAPFGQEP